MENTYLAVLYLCVLTVSHLLSLRPTHNPLFKALTLPQVSALALLVYDWLILLDREIEHIWQSGWSIPKVLFIVTRHGTFFDMPILMAIEIAPYGTIDSDTCNALFKIAIWSSFIAFCTSEIIILLRTSAIYSGSKRVIISLSIAYAAISVAGFVITWRSLHPKPLPSVDSASGPNGCFADRGMMTPFLPDVLMLLVFELAILVLTIRRGFRDSFSGIRTPLLRAVYRDSIGFFLALIMFTLFAILVHVLVPPRMNGFMAPFVRVVPGIICCRILLNLRQAATPRGPSTILKSTILQFATAPEQEMNQAETVQLEIYSVRNKENSRHQADGDFVEGHS